MDDSAIQEAAARFVNARRTKQPMDRLPPELRPATVAEAHAIQDAIVAGLGDQVAGWKVAAMHEQVLRGVIMQSVMFPDGGRVPAGSIAMYGVEAEVAFRFDRDMAPRGHDYDYEEVAAAVTAMAAIEIVDSRFANYRDTPVIERAADFISNGGFVHGTLQPDWRKFEMTKLAVTLTINGVVVAQVVGTHPTVDPLLPAVSLVNVLRKTGGVRAGQVMTTGTYTGLNMAGPGQQVKADFGAFGSVQVSF